MRMTIAEQTMYQVFMQTFPYCMATGVTQHITLYWLDYPRVLQNAHILGGPQRTHDRRNIVRLSKLAHDLSHGYVIRGRDGMHLPKLTRANMLWIKQRQDPKYFDLDYLNSIGIQRMPTPEEPPAWFLAEFERWQPELYREQTVEQFRGE